MEGSAQMGHSITSVHQISGLEERAGDNIERMLGIKDSTSFCGSWLRRDTWVVRMPGSGGLPCLLWSAYCLLICLPKSCCCCYPLLCRLLLCWLAGCSSCCQANDGPPLLPAAAAAAAVAASSRELPHLLIAVRLELLHLHIAAGTGAVGARCWWC